jgi:hypothetical protein
MIPVIAYSTKTFPWMGIFAESATRGGLNLIQIINDSGVNFARFKAFVSNYRHLSPNPLAFELACFERYFAISSYASEKGYSSFYMSDTDILFNEAVDDELRLITEGVDVMLSRPHRGHEGASRMIEYSPHFSFWTKKAIDDFIDFFVKTYSTDEGRDLIDRTYRSNKEIAPYSGVSDMTLCHLWIDANKPRFRNSVFTEDRVTIDHNIAMGDHKVKNQFKRSIGMKSLDVVDGKLFFQNSNGGLSYPLVMHFQGKYKILMRDVFERKLARASAKAALVSGVRIAKWLGSQAMAQVSTGGRRSGAAESRDNATCAREERQRHG